MSIGRQFAASALGRTMIPYMGSTVVTGTLPLPGTPGPPGGPTTFPAEDFGTNAMTNGTTMQQLAGTAGLTVSPTLRQYLPLILIFGLIVLVLLKK